MARKTQQSNLALGAETVTEILAAIKDLLETHSEEVSTAIDESDDKKLTVNCGIDLDCSETAPSINVRLRFSTSVTDKRTIRCDDPAQMTFTTLTPAQMREQKEAQEQAEDAAQEATAKAGRKAKKKKGDPEPETNGEEPQDQE
jgi:hypothetical protein